MHVRNIIIEEEYTKLKAAVTKRKTILNGKRKVIHRKHHLTTPEILAGLIDAEKKDKEKEENRSKKEQKSGK